MGSGTFPARMCMILEGQSALLRNRAGLQALAATPATDQVDDALPAPAQRALTFGLLLSALRCTVQYILLPVVLPWAGFAAAIPTWILLLLGIVAIGFLARNVRNLWMLHHARRWRYFALASIATAALLVF